MIDFNKPVQTRDGRKVRILCTDGQHPIFPIVGFIGDEADVYEWTRDGAYNDQSFRQEDVDIINVPERVERWLNIYPGNVGSINSSRKNADESVDSSARRIGVIRITYEDGKPVAVALEAA